MSVAVSKSFPENPVTSSDMNNLLEQLRVGAEEIPERAGHAETPGKMPYYFNMGFVGYVVRLVKEKSGTLSEDVRIDAQNSLVHSIGLLHAKGYSTVSAAVLLNRAEILDQHQNKTARAASSRSVSEHPQVEPARVPSSESVRKNESAKTTVVPAVEVAIPTPAMDDDSPGPRFVK